MSKPIPGGPGYDMVAQHACERFELSNPLRHEIAFMQWFCCRWQDTTCKQKSTASCKYGWACAEVRVHATRSWVGGYVSVYVLRACFLALFGSSSRKLIFVWALA